MGSSGLSTGTHLHYEVWVNDRAANPAHFVPHGQLPEGLFAMEPPVSWQ
jgi:murein DD-endopeptidase MepM/ murein hydrolase activator NlpD